MKQLSFNRYDYAAFLTFATYSFCSLIIPLTLLELSGDLGFTITDGGKGLGGALQLGRAIPMVIGMIFCGVLAGRIGKARSLGFALLCMGTGIMLSAFSPGYAILFVLIAFAGIGEGVIEGIATPFIQDQHPEEPGRYINFTHSFWSVGVVGVTLVAGFMLYCGISWRVIVFLTGLLSMLPAIMLFWPDRKVLLKHEDSRANASQIWDRSVEIMKIPRFWVFFAAMFLAGGGEFCLTFWAASYIRLEYPDAGIMSAGYGTAFFAAGMIVGRMISGFCVSQKNLRKLILWTAAFATLFGCFLPFVDSIFVLFLFLFILGLGTGPFWPSIQSLSTNRMKVDNTMLFVLLSCSGVPGCGFFTMVMGVMGDSMGLRAAMYLVPGCFLVMGLLVAIELLVPLKEKPLPCD